MTFFAAHLDVNTSVRTRELYQLIDINDDHALVLGRVVAMSVRDDAVLDRVKCYIDTARLDLIGRMRSPNLYCRTDSQFEMVRASEE